MNIAEMTMLTNADQLIDALKACGLVNITWAASKTCCAATRSTTFRCWTSPAATKRKLGRSTAPRRRSAEAMKPQPALISLR